MLQCNSIPYQSFENECNKDICSQNESTVDNDCEQQGISNFHLLCIYRIADIADGCGYSDHPADPADPAV